MEDDNYSSLVANLTLLAEDYPDSSSNLRGIKMSDYNRVGADDDDDENVCSRMERWKVWTIGIAAGCVFLTGVIIFAVSWGIIYPTEYGFLYNKITGHIDTSRVYESGRYCIGPAHYFVKFPLIQTTVEFSNRGGADSSPVVTRTQDGVAITLSFSFQYKFDKNSLKGVYNLYTTNYQQPMLRVARNSILQVASNFTSTQYWLGRQLITNDMEHILKNNVQSTILCEVESFQLLHVQLPQAYEDSIIATQVQQQQVKQQQYQKQVAAVLSQIQQIMAVTNQNITVISSHAEQPHQHTRIPFYPTAYQLPYADALSINDYLDERETDLYGILNTARITAFNYTQHVQAAAYANLQTNLNMNSTQLMRYMKVRAIRQKKEGSIVVGLTAN